MSIQSEIMRIASARDEIAAAIEAKGVPAAGTPLAGLAAKAAAIVQSMVKTVCGKAPDSGGNIALSAKDVSARPDTWTPTAAQVGATPTTRKINGKALSADVTLSAADVGAVPTSRTVNGKALSSNITLSKSDVGLGNVDNTADSAKSVASSAKLTTARTIRINLKSTSTASFDGSKNITPGVTGTLPISNGGTGATSASAALSALGAARKDHSHNGQIINPLSVEITPLVGAAHGGFIDYHYGGSTDDYTVRLWENTKGNLNCTGTFTSASSRKIKENIIPITEDEARKVLELNPVHFDYKSFYPNKRKDNLGLIAEEVARVIPQAVDIPEDYDEETFDENDTSFSVPAISYTSLIPHMIRMIQVQQRQIESLEKKLAEIK